MKERLLVMNGQRIVQAEKDGAWTNQKVDKAGALKPGIYNLYTARVMDGCRGKERMIFPFLMTMLLLLLFGLFQMMTAQRSLTLIHHPGRVQGNLRGLLYYWLL